MRLSLSSMLLWNLSTAGTLLISMRLIWNAVDWNSSESRQDSMHIMTCSKNNRILQYIKSSSVKKDYYSNKINNATDQKHAWAVCNSLVHKTKTLCSIFISMQVNWLTDLIRFLATTWQNMEWILKNCRWRIKRICSICLNVNMLIKRSTDDRSVSVEAHKLWLLLSPAA